MNGVPNTAGAAPHQQELPLTSNDVPMESMLARNLFRGRVSLYLSEVAMALRISEQHVRNLIESGELEATRISINLVTERVEYRVPVVCWDSFIRKRWSK